MTTSEYGSWPSAITAELVVEAAVSLGEVVAGEDDIWWSELRPQDAGRVMVVRHTPGGRDVDVLPEGYSARTRVHEYGGGAWWLHDDTLFFANWPDQRLYRIEPDTEPGSFLAPVPLTPEPAQPQGDRYADGVLSADGHWVICVRERHEAGATEARNEIVALEADPSGPPAEPLVLVSGPDFVAAPRVSPDGGRLCWIQWHHPDMPWDGTELVVADLEADADECRLSQPTVLAGSRDESVTQPEWHADGTLWFLSDRSNWWNLYRIDADATVVPVAPLDAEIGVPHWVFGQSRYAFLADGRVAVAYASGGLDHLAVITPGPTGQADVLVDLEAEFVALASLRPYGHGLVFLGGSAARETVVAVADLPAHGDATIGIIRPGRPLGLGPEWFAEPQSLSVELADGSQTHAVFYPPTHPQARGPQGAAPPLLVLSHGGPTSAARPQLSLGIQYWTSRGFAVVDVNYRGSSGYGREYRQALVGQWGVADVDDCVAVARHLADAGLVDPQRRAIRGGSAGGYTTLAALAFRDEFQAGTSLYGVADLEALARDTHKFESRYLDSLVGPYPAEADRYRERSPIHHVEGFDCPLLVLQGLEDEIVPPAQSEMIVAAVRDKGLPVAYLAFEGEQHGFRQAATIKRALEAELYFYSKVFDFELAEPIEAVVIDNL
jgi:dipeptidyl aminopeptidase/acylaminoacyl peptidase